MRQWVIWNWRGVYYYSYHRHRRNLGGRGCRCRWYLDCRRRVMRPMPWGRGLLDCCSLLLLVVQVRRSDSATLKPATISLGPATNFCVGIPTPELRVDALPLFFHLVFFPPSSAPLIPPAAKRLHHHSIVDEMHFTTPGRCVYHALYLLYSRASSLCALMCNICNVCWRA